MMNKRNIGILILAFMLFQTTFSQSNLLNAKRPSDIGKKTAEQKAVDNDRPLDYGYVDDRDILWSKVVWEYIDLNERINLPLYYPVDTTTVAGNRRSLFDTLLGGIKNDKITEVYDDSYFTAKLTKAEINSKLYRVDTTEAGIDELNAGNTNIEEYIDRITLTSQDIEGYKFKGLWYFDKRQAEMKYRLLGIAPVAPDVNTIDQDTPDLVPLFWVFFPDARNVLHEAKAFNNENSSIPFSFDHILNARRFHGYIYKEENVQGDRAITEYVSQNSLMQLLESDRIKDKITQLPQKALQWGKDMIQGFINGIKGIIIRNYIMSDINDVRNTIYTCYDKSGNEIYDIMGTYQNIQRNKHFQPDPDWLQVKTIDMHTGGEPLRVITEGFPELKGDSVLE